MSLKLDFRCDKVLLHAGCAKNTLESGAVHSAGSGWVVLTGRETCFHLKEKGVERLGFCLHFGGGTLVCD